MEKIKSKSSTGKKSKGKSRLIYLIILFILSFFLIIQNTNAFELSKSLIQLERDDNYPCYIEKGDTIVCPPIDSKVYSDWKTNLTNIVNEKGIILNGIENIISWFTGDLTDADKLSLLESSEIPYTDGKIETTINMTKEYRAKVNIASLGNNKIRIGFATNVFGVLGNPMENFDINSSSGMVRYRPLNMTWLDFNATNYVKIGLDDMGNALEGIETLTVSAWVKTNNSDNQAFVVKHSTSTIGSWVLGYEQGLWLVLINSTADRKDLFYNSSELLNGNWNNVVLQYNSTDLIAYLNGVEVNRTNHYGKIQSSSQSVTVGNLFAGEHYLNGSIDEVRAYNTTISPSEIYNSGRKRNDSLSDKVGSVLYLPLNERYGNITYLFNRTKEWQSYGASISNKNWVSDNINVTTLNYEINLSIVNITSARIVWDNNSIWNDTDQLTFTGNATFIFNNNQTLWIYENYLGDRSNCTAYTGSGNFQIDCSTNCSMNQTVNLLWNNFSTTAKGNIYLDNITNIGRREISEGCKLILKQGSIFG